MADLEIVGHSLTQTEDPENVSHNLLRKVAQETAVSRSLVRTVGQELADSVKLLPK